MTEHVNTFEECCAEDVVVQVRQMRRLRADEACRQALRSPRSQLRAGGAAGVVGGLLGIWTTFSGRPEFEGAPVSQLNVGCHSEILVTGNDDSIAVKRLLHRTGHQVASGASQAIRGLDSSISMP